MRVAGSWFGRRYLLRLDTGGGREEGKRTCGRRRRGGGRRGGLLLGLGVVVEGGCGRRCGGRGRGRVGCLVMDVSMGFGIGVG